MPLNHRLVDSMPIVMAQNNRRFKACIASELADKSGYCAAKNLYYYGVKLHILASYQVGCMPIPESIGLTHAGMNDGKAYELLCNDPKVKQYTKFGDKAYPHTLIMPNKAF
ncbi:transposase [Facilibium subflavum]|uniref:transposase n=1 Tax=Facilibium subflavum TaxID=2219058 RepID=UPI000E6484C7|nr:transposase [Facilibium subflavum]